MAKRKATDSTYTDQDLDQQRLFVEQRKADGFGFTLVAPETFVQSMRDSGYKSTATAINEFIDNAIQAGAQHVDVVLGYPSTNDTKKKLTPESGGGYIAIVDDGHGMDAEMIRWAVIWGGTHRENNRTGFGRFGFGLPSAAVSISNSFEVYSKVPGGEWNVVRVDLEDIKSGKLRNEEGTTVVPEATPATLPGFVKAALRDGDLPHGTVIVLDHLDRLSPGFIQSQSFKENELHMIGLTYREIMRNVKIRVIDVANTVDITEVQPIDPLFLRPDARYYDENEVLATALPGTNFRVKALDSRNKEAGTVRVRYSYMHGPRFTKGTKGRMKVRIQNNGFIIMRAGRQIDVVSKNPWTVVLNNDKFWGCEIDFDPSLDELFGVTTNKQQIVVQDRMWDLLEENGVYQAIQQLRADYKRQRAAEQLEAQERENEPRESEDIAAKTAKFRGRRAVPPTPDKQRESEEGLEKEVKRTAHQTGRSEADVKPEVEAELEAIPFKVWFEELPGAPFYRMLPVGGQKRLFINTAHRFYTDLYSGPGATQRMKTALELLLIVLGECEVEASVDGAKFYRVERNEWSRRLDIMLEELDQREPLEDLHEELDTAREEAPVS